MRLKIIYLQLSHSVHQDTLSFNLKKHEVQNKSGLYFSPFSDREIIILIKNSFVLLIFLNTIFSVCLSDLSV
jgi:hypothetical protein